MLNEMCVLHAPRTIEKCFKADKSLEGICFGRSAELEANMGRGEPPEWATVELQQAVYQERGIKIRDSYSELARLRFIESLKPRKSRNIRKLFTQANNLFSIVKNDKWCANNASHKFNGAECQKCGWGKEVTFFNLGFDPFQGPVPPINWKHKKNFDKKVEREFKRIAGLKDAQGNPLRAFSDTDGKEIYWGWLEKTHKPIRHSKPNDYGWLGRDFTNVREGNTWRMNVTSVRWIDGRLDSNNKCDMCGKLCPFPIHKDRMKEKGEWHWMSDSENERGYTDQMKEKDFVRLRQNAPLNLIERLERHDATDLTGLDLTSSVSRQECLKKFNRSVIKLPKQQRMAYQLQKHLGLSVKDVAVEMKLRENTVKTYLRLAVEKLKGLSV